PRAPAGDAVGVLIDDADDGEVDAHPEELDQRPHDEVGAKHHGAHDRVAGAGEPDAGVAGEGFHRGWFYPPTAVWRRRQRVQRRRQMAKRATAEKSCNPSPCSTAAGSAMRPVMSAD